MEREKGTFTVNEVIGDICDKMISRHPHVFASAVAETSAAVLDAWDKKKKKEKQRLTVKDEMEAVPKMLPALMRTQKVTGKAMKNGYAFDYESDMTDEALVEELFRCAVLLKKRGINAEEQLTEKVNAFIENYKD
jgi:tetrapyrrole methylase family protein/MazG family protein